VASVGGGGEPPAKGEADNAAEDAALFWLKVLDARRGSEAGRGRGAAAAEC